jgi:hypothetical protein
MLTHRPSHRGRDLIHPPRPAVVPRITRRLAPPAEPPLRTTAKGPPRLFPLRRDIMHPMFKELFIDADADADDPAAGDGRRRRGRRSRRARAAAIIRPAAAGRRETRPRP